MRRIKRTSNYEINVELKEDSFLKTPNPVQRGRVVATRLDELAMELDALDEAVKHYVTGGQPEQVADRAQGRLAAENIMEDWQEPIMAAMAQAVTHNKGDVLEIGFGRGVAAEFVQTHTPQSHTLIECNRAVIDEYFVPWRETHKDQTINMVEGFWEDTLDGLGKYDGILFHTYPLSDDEYVERVQQSVTFAAHFFEHAAAHLKPGGRFTYLTMEEDSLSRAHQRLLLQHFDGYRVSKIDGLNIPQDTRDAHWAQSMVLIETLGK